MTKNPRGMTCSRITEENDECDINVGVNRDKVTPLSRTCGCGKVKVCKVRGGRKMCARMAQLGVMPGSEMKLICPGKSKKCMVRVKGSTVALDELQSSNIFVTPA